MKPNEKKGESREVARVHWMALKEFLAAWIERGASSTKADPGTCSFFVQNPLLPEHLLEKSSLG